MTQLPDNHSLIAAVGMFDGVHLGHRFLFDCLKKRAADGTRPLAITFANHPLSVVRPRSAPRLLTTADEKATLIRSLGIDVAMLTFDDNLRQLTARDFLAMIRQRYGVSRLLLGFNNHFGSDRGNTLDDYQRFGAEIGVAIESAPRFDLGQTTVSSTTIRDALAKGNVDDARQMLGRPYRVSGLVEHGQRLGRSIGFPTANIPIGNDGKAIIANGVYAADALLADGSTHRAIVNIGSRPTVAADGAINLEAHIDKYSGDLYGTQLQIDLLSRLRDERRFPSIDALAAQLRDDLNAARLLQ
jgi:riboflavin kinase/FMN adenylyltransferase